MTFFTVAFDYDNTSYMRLLSVLEKSIAISCPEAKFVALRKKPPRTPPEGRKQGLLFYENTDKLADWLDFVECSDDPDIVLLDCDMMVLQDVSEVFEEEFDVGFTRRANHKRIPFNGGVFFVRQNQESVNFFKKFKQINDQMYEDHEFHQLWRDKYAGMNQAAFGWMFENYFEKIDLLELPCEIYNVCSGWNVLSENYKIIHIKSQLKQACLGSDVERRYSAIVGRWKEIECMEAVDDQNCNGSV